MTDPEIERRVAQVIVLLLAGIVLTVGGYVFAVAQMRGHW